MSKFFIDRQIVAMVIAIAYGLTTLQTVGIPLLVFSITLPKGT